MRTVLMTLVRTRLGVAFILAAVVLMIVGVSRLAGGSSSPSSFDMAPEATAAVARSIEPDDGAESPQVAQSPSVAPGAPGPLSVATAFAAGWVDHDRSAESWLSALRPHSTQRLLGELAGVEPENVPANRVTGEAKLIPQASAITEVEIPVDAGILRLRLVGPDGHWFVDGIDWSRS